MPQASIDSDTIKNSDEDAIQIRRSDNSEDLRLNKTVTGESQCVLDLKLSEESVDTDEENLTAWEEIMATWDLSKSRRMLLLIPLMIWSSTSLSIYQASFGPLMVLGMPSDWDDDKQL